MERREFLKSAGLAALAVPVFTSLFTGAPAKADEMTALDAKPARHPAPSLDPATRDLLGELVDVIIPATDTPGAKAAGVVGFIETMSFNWLPEEEYKLFLKHTSDFGHAIQKKYGKAFQDLSPAEKLAVLSQLDAASPLPAASGPMPDKVPYIKLLKQFTLYGYYTSKIGGSQELSFNPMPGYYEPCAKFGPNDRAPDMYWVNKYSDLRLT